MGKPEIKPEEITHAYFQEKVNNSLVGELHHQHLLVKAFVRNPPKEEIVLNEWLKELVEKIGMKIVIGPFSKYVSACGNSGLTGAVIIETSHIAAHISTSHVSCHIWDEPSPAMIQLDCYSCSYYDPEVLLKHLGKFHLASYEVMVIDRNKNFQVLDSKIVTL
jgi:S-adenosylmethionine/arginine decarboxylase-like enzyme